MLGMSSRCGLLHLFHHRDQVGHVIEKIVDPPDIHVPGELPHRQADDVFGIMAVAEQAGAPADGLEQGPGHGLAGRCAAVRRG